ncbi:MAG: cadmium-translocating P-type ATPase [Alphaproteobacteria bacterium]|nr:cadmium-translocating P-type ATPase [Alphaproteobacteria bacterium]
MMAMSETALDIAIGGMTCAACVGRVETALRRVPGVQAARVNLASERAHVEGQALDARALIEAVEAAGYDARPATDDAPSPPDREPWILVLGAALTLPLIAPMALAPLGVHAMLPPWLELVLATPIQIVLGARFYRGAWAALRARAGSMDVLVALGTTAAYLYSLALVSQTGDDAHGRLYFEGAAVILVLVRLGKWLEGRAKRATTRALRGLMALRPNSATILRDGVERVVPIAEVRPGDRMIVRPGECVPTDGRILAGRAAFDESMLTGESLPVDKAPGDRVAGGTIDRDGLLTVEAQAVGADTVLARIVAAVERAQAAKAPIEALVDRISAVFVPAVIGFALVTFAAWLALGGGFERALVAAVAVLVIACPCALGLATPAAMIVGLGRAAELGILVRDAAALEHARAIDTVVFDKTGTLTEGRPVVTEILPAAGFDVGAVLRLAASAQQGSEHPLAKAVLARAADQGLALEAPVEFLAVPGQGIEASIDGKRLRIGSRAFVGATTDTAALEAKGQSVMHLALDGRPLGAIAVADRPRPQARAAVATLRARGIEVWMLTGDSARTARTVADELGIARLEAEILPEGKLATIGRLRGQGRVVAMVGDGINDAPALAGADVGIAIGGGADVAVEAAGLALLRPDPELVPLAIDLARAVTDKIRHNLFWAFIYNVVGLPLAALGWLTPGLAGAAMAASSVSVLASALLLRRFHARSAP